MSCLRLIFLLWACLLYACGEEDGPGPLKPGEVHFAQSATQVTLSLGERRAVIDKPTARLMIEDHGRILVTALPPQLVTGTTSNGINAAGAAVPFLVDGKVRGAQLGVTDNDATHQWTVEFISDRAIASRLRPAASATVDRIVTSLAVTSTEHFYGLTERMVDAPGAAISDRNASEVAPREIGSLDRRGQTITMEITPTLGLYTPFFHSSAGYGVFVEGTMPGRYDIAKADAERVTLNFEFNRRTGEHSLVFFAGNYTQVLNEYYTRTGRPFVPPAWGFLHWRWRDEHAIGSAMLDGVAMNAQVVEDITMYEKLGIPAGSYEFDRPWTSGTTDRGQDGFASFTFDPERFPNSAAMIQSLKRRGSHVFVFGAPWALGDNAVDAERFGYYAPRNDILIDYTNPAAVSWWKSRVQTLIDQGIDGIKLDRAELQPTSTELLNMPNRATDIFTDGRNGREMTNAYAVDYARVHYDAFHERVGDNFLHYLRAGYAGSQRYAVFWGGDITGRNSLGLGLGTDLGLRSALQALAHVSFMGFPVWGTDTGGYYQFTDREVFARWLEFSAICPIMEIGGGGSHAPWDMPSDPTYDDELIRIYRRYTTLHHQLAASMHTWSLQARDSGRPPVRPLLFDFPDDAAVADLWDEFIVGDDIIAAPLWKSGARTREVYLPQGTWTNFWNGGERFVGPATLTIDAPLDRLPLFVREGAAPPIQPGALP